jgi:hypothetical protein
VITVEPSEGFFLRPLGPGTTIGHNGLLKVVARDASGHQIAVVGPEKIK